MDINMTDVALDENLDLIESLFSNLSNVISPAEVKKMWADYIEFTINGRTGWHALWKMSRSSCEQLNVTFPSVVRVKVEEINYHTLCADICITDTRNQDTHCVDLIYLFPAKQTNDNIDDIADCLVLYRFFFSHLWHPWENMKETNWVGNCLQPRIALFRDMQAGQITLPVIKHIRTTFCEAKRLHKKLLALKEEMEELEKQMSENLDIAEYFLEKIEEVRKIEERFNRVRNEIAMFEEPTLRSVISHEKRNEPIPKKRVFIVWLGNKWEEKIEFVEQFQCSIGEDTDVQLSCSLPLTLQEANDDDTLCLLPGLYFLNFEIPLLRKGIVRGFPGSSDVKLCISAGHPEVHDWEGKFLQIQNVTLLGKEVEYLFLIRRGKVTFEKCVLCGEKGMGLHVMPGCTLELHQCEIRGLDIGIIVHPQARLILNQSTVKDCNTGIKIANANHIDIESSSIVDCSEFGLVVSESGCMSEENKNIDPISRLNWCENFRINDITMERNDSDILIIPQPFT